MTTGGRVIYKYSTISHLIDILGQLAPTTLLLALYRDSFSVSSFLKIGSMAVSLSSNSDSEQAPCMFDEDDRWWWWWSRLFDRCLCSLTLLLWLLSGATLGVDWWCEWCDLTSFRFCAQSCASMRCSRSLSVSLWHTGIFCLCRCFRFFSETLRCITPLALPVLMPPGEPFSW